ncbi:hypothetical protein HK098_007373, partial [Nowakowskiella sp. JEL0407]
NNGNNANTGNNVNNGNQAVSGKNCNAKKVEVVVVGNEQRFGFDGQQVALNPIIPIDRICNSFAQDAECKSRCEAAKAVAAATGVKGNSQGQGDLAAMQKLADDFNAAMAGSGSVAPAAGGNTGNNGNVANGGNNNAGGNNNDGGAAVIKGDLGSCSADAAKLVVKLGADSSDAQRAKEVRFIPGGFKVDPIFGGQGSALNGGIVANFICDRLASDCKASAATVASCRAAQVKVNGQKGGANLSADQVAALEKVAADFNAAIGIVDGNASGGNGNQANGSGAVAEGNTGGNGNAGTGANGKVDVTALLTLLKKAVALLEA